MLDIMRRKKESIVIKSVFVVIVLSFIGTMFLVWGKGSDGAGRSLGYAAKVDGSRISLEEYQGAYQRIRDIYQQIYGQAFNSEMEKVLGLKKAALDNLIDNRLILKEAGSLGVKVTKDEVASSIAAMPTFQKDGAFSFDLYQQILKSSRMTPKDFEAAQKNDLTLQKARQAIMNKAVVSDEEALAQYRKEHDKVDLEYVAYAPADVAGEVKLTEADLNDYLQKHADEFKTPEKVALSYAVLDPTSQAAKLTVSDDEIQTYYQKNIDRWQGKDGILPLQEVKDKVRAEALRQKASKQAFELAADTLYKNIKSGDLNQIASQLHLKVQDTPLFSATAPAAALANEAAVVKKGLELKQGELGGPVETPKGIYIIKAKERKPAAVPPLAEIRAAVEQKAKAAKAAELAKTKAEEAAKQLAAKTPLKTATTGVFGYSAKGDVPVIGASPDLMDAAFKLTTAAPAAATPFKVGNRWYAVRLKSRAEAPRADFDKTKEQIKKAMLPKKQEEALATWIKEQRAKTKIELNQTLVAEK
ncbi:peptidylprolyl isomerase [Geobacter sp. SVR]|uniref:peptidylprolyl isomerase n=1 Tax=Geobacter sp. SVR TaxID=2495594 RepID=UPI00143F018F|nr:peptidylprolyl isomerase [Geobacter sp. SVR]BCS55451.1 peptidylprolyl isomerase [Geobacter sp. SVR]GCF83454.1 peptidylprolyl isomerase [Geobacter sp. SVR]